MTEEKKAGGSGFLWGVAIGAAVGAVSALLLAPKAGKELRQDIAETSRNATGKTRELADTAAGKAKEAAKQVSGVAGELGSKVKDTAIYAAETAAIVKDGVTAWAKDLRAPGLIDITETRNADPLTPAEETASAILPEGEAPKGEAPKGEAPKASE